MRATLIAELAVVASLQVAAHFSDLDLAQWDTHMRHNDGQSASAPYLTSRNRRELAFLSSMPIALIRPSDGVPRCSSFSLTMLNLYLTQTGPARNDCEAANLLMLPIRNLAEDNWSETGAAMYGDELIDWALGRHFWDDLDDYIRPRIGGSGGNNDAMALVTKGVICAVDLFSDAMAVAMGTYILFYATSTDSTNTRVAQTYLALLSTQHCR